MSLPREPHPPQEPKEPLEEALPRLSLERRITVLVLLATLLVVGLVAAVGIPLELFPQGYTAPFLWVSVPWRDAPAQEVVDKVVRPLEEELATVRGAAAMNSYATSGFGRVFLTFKSGTDMDVAYREVRDRVQRARSRLPPDADRLFIRKEDLSGVPIYMVGLAIEPGVTDAWDLIQQQVVLPLSRVEGVAAVSSFGLEPKEILIELDRRRTEAAGLNIYQLAQQLAGDNFTLASGDVRAGGRELLLRSVARYGSVEELENRPVAPGVSLADIAEVRYDEAEKNYRARAFSRPAVALHILKEGDANTLEVARRLDRVFEEIQADPRLAGNLRAMPLFDQGEVILESLSTLLDSGRVGALFALSVLFFFLRRLRMTLIITLSIPLSIVVALTVMYFAGETLNILSLLGLMISVGLLVDNSVVVAENIHRLHREGVARRQAAIRGAGEIALAIVMATLTTVAVFLPVSLVEGDGQFFLQRLAIPISVSLLASLLVALVFVPLSIYLTLPARRGTGGRSVARAVHQRLNGALATAYDATFGRLNRAYLRLLAFFLAPRRWLDLTALLLLATGLTAGAMSLREFEITAVDRDESNFFEIDAELPPSTTLEEAEEYFLAAERILERRQEEFGLEGYFIFHRSTQGEIQGWFPNPRTGELTPREVTERLLAELPEKPGVKLYTGDEDEQEESKKSEHTFTLYGEDPEQLETVAAGLENLFTAVDGVLGIKKAAERAPDELALIVDRERAHRQGVNPSVVAGVVSYALRGQALPKYYRDGREIPVRIRFREEDRASLAQLADFAVPLEEGGTVALSAITDVHLLPSAKTIFRRDRRTARTLTLELAADREEETRELLRERARLLDLPEGVRLGHGDGPTQDEEDLRGVLLAMGLSIVFIYLLMGFLFESFVLPLSIITTIPLASLGVVWIHLLTGRDMDFLGTVGAVLLIGVVVNNGIVLVDYVNRLRAEGHERGEALLRAARLRFRPIMMTALTTICGMIPLTLGGTTAIGLNYKSFGYTLIGGMTTATLLTLLVVPVSYALFDDIREALARTLRRALAPRPAAGESEAG